jgi:hypothetical protein
MQPGWKRVWLVRVRLEEKCGMQFHPHTLRCPDCHTQLYALFVLHYMVPSLNSSSNI